MMVLPILIWTLQVGASDAPGSDVAAQVNGEIITWMAVQKELKGIDPKSEGYEKLKRDQLRNMVEHLLFVQESKKLGITFADRDVEEEIGKTVRRLGGDDKYLDWLRFNRMSREQHRVKVKEDMLVSTVMQAERYVWRNPESKIPGTKVALTDNVTPAEIRAYYLANQDKFKAVEWATVNRLQAIYASPEEREKKLAIIRMVQRRVEEGADFDVLCQLYGEGFEDPRNPKKDITFEKAARDNHPFGAEVGAWIFDRLKDGGLTDVVDDGKSLTVYQLAHKEVVPAKSQDEAWTLIREQIAYERWKQNIVRLRTELMKPPAFVAPRDLFEEARP